MGTRAEHVEWCKKRALEYLDAGDLPNAFASMSSDMRKRDDTQYPEVLDQLGMMEIMNRNSGGLRCWIEGFN